MKSNILKSAVAITLLGASLIAAAQTSDPSTASKVGTKIDHAAVETKDAAVGAGHDVKEGAETAAHKTKNAAEVVGHDTKKVAIKAKNKVKHAVKRHPAADSDAHSSAP